MTPVTAADLDRWEALAAAATPGPWERDVDCEFIATSRTAVAALVAALREALETNARLNRRSQIAEAAIADLTREPVGGRKHRSVAAEVWERCEESHGLACRTTREGRAEVERLREGIEALAAEMQSDTCPSCHAYYADEGSTTWGCDHTEGMQHAGDMLRALLADAQAITAAETTAAPGPHSGTPATVEAVSVAHSDGE